MLKKFDGGSSNRVDNIITGDESCFYYYDPQTKRQSEVWIAKFVDTVLLANILFLMKSGFNTIIPLENGKTVIAK